MANELYPSGPHTHADPDNSGQCIYCGRVLDGSDEPKPLTDVLMLKMQDDGTPTRWRCLKCEHEFDGPAVDVDRGAASVTMSATVPACPLCVEAAGTPATIAEPKPLTADELDEIDAIDGPAGGDWRPAYDRWATQWNDRHDDFDVGLNMVATHRLVAEVRRLRTENQRLREPDQYVEVTRPGDKDRSFIKKADARKL